MHHSACFFDLDGTLYSRDELIKQLVEDQYNEFRNELSHRSCSDYVSRVLELDDHGYHPKEQVYAQIAKEWEIGDDIARSLLAHFWDTYDSYCHLPEDTLRTLQALHDSGVRLGIVTNGQSRRQNKKIDALGIRDYFDAIVISEAEGVKKPAPEIFHRALSRCRVTAEDALFIGDHPVADIDGARGAGLAAVWKKVPYWSMTRTDVLVVERLTQLLD